MASPPSVKTHKPSSRSSSLTFHLTLLNNFSVLGVAWTAIAFVSVLHLAALTLFTRGFLLSRTTLDNRNTCDVTSIECTLPAKYDRTVILLVDALRYDFIFPKNPNSEGYNPTHHNQFTLPAQLTASHPRHSLLFKGVADPPTATLQRLKALTTGSLPTFVDIGSNFAGSAVTEDSWIEQATRVGKRVAFVGDDTWLTIFPESAFAPNLTFPFDSFNVEDLDTVDNGVRHHTLPLLEQPVGQSSWDILIAHPLGLDHAGHRFGAAHSETTRKLREMNDLVHNIVDRLNERDLLIVLGDHGMDAKGDHGGDSPDETDAALWFYSKTPLTISNPLQSLPFESTGVSLQQLLAAAPDNGAVSEFFVYDDQLERSLSQISIVPTLSLLMGVPIPFNNLATIIPELFLESSDEGASSRKFWKKHPSPPSAYSLLLKAMQINAEQIKTYIDAYTAHPAGKDLLPARQQLLHLYEIGRSSQGDTGFSDLQRFTYATLKSTRQIWARFDPVLMGAGLVTMAGSLLVAWRLYCLCRSEGCLFRQRPLRQSLSIGICSSIVGVLLGVAGWLSTQSSDQSVDIANLALFVGSITAVSGFLVASFGIEDTAVAQSRSLSLSNLAAVTVMLFHTIMFAANSYTMWEDRIVSFLLQIPPLFLFAASFAYAGDTRQRRTQLFSLVCLIIGRLNAFSTICREEQHPYCTATFYGRIGVSSSTPWLLIAACVSATVLPSLLRRFLDIARAYQGWSKAMLRYSYRLLFIAGSLYWVADHFEDTTNRDVQVLLIASKTTLARMTLICALALGSTFWALSPLCIAVEERQIIDQKGEIGTQITITGFANGFGSYYLLFILAPFAIISLLSPPMGQVVLSLTLLSSLAYFESNDSLCDMQAERQAKDTSIEANITAPSNLLGIVFVVLQGLQSFFSTGHQAVLASIQWKSAFVGFKTLTYPFSPLLVLLNTLGPILLSAAILPLLVLWKRSPTLKGGPSSAVVRDLLRASLGFLIYHTLITLATATFAAHLRRHLMVWKVFAPRFVLSAICLLAIDAFFLLLIVPWGIRRTLMKVQRTFGTAYS